MKQAFVRDRVTLGGVGMVAMLEHLTTIRCHRCEEHTQAVYKKMEMTSKA